MASTPNPRLRNFAVQVALTAAASAATLKATDAATDYIYVTKFQILITTNAANKTTSMSDSTPTSYLAYTDLAVAAGLNQTGAVNYDFGRRGIKLAQGKSLTVTSVGSGSAGWAYAEGYQASV